MQKIPKTHPRYKSLLYRKKISDAMNLGITHITGLKPKGKLWAFFGSYGWSGGAVRYMVELAEKVGFEVYKKTLEVKYVPNKDELDKCFRFGEEIANKFLEAS